ncbi:TFIIB-type zinc ribbon-containing protein [Microbacterium trichothecenolyticum]
MKCPLDANDLLITERAGVEIDYCPQCRGVWLDRGELDKIIDRGSGGAGSRSGSDFTDPSRDHKGHRTDHGRADRDHSGRRRREGFLGDLFDF